MSTSQLNDLAFDGRSSRKYIIVVNTQNLTTDIVPVDDGPLDLGLLNDSVSTDSVDELGFQSIAHDVDIWFDTGWALDDDLTAFTITDADGVRILDADIVGNAVITSQEGDRAYGFEADRAITIVDSLNVQFLETVR
jgi:hypothetical protein